MQIKRAIQLGLMAVVLATIGLFTTQPALAQSPVIIYKNSAMSCGSISTGGADLILLSSGAITITGDIDTGGGNLVIGAGVAFTPSGTPTSSSECSGASKGNATLNSSAGSSDITVDGNLTAQNVNLYTANFELSGGTVDVGFDLIVSNGNFLVEADDSVNIGHELKSFQGVLSIKALDSSSDTITIGYHTSAPMVVLAAGGDINTGNIFVQNGGEVRIFANEADSSSNPFIVGGSSNPNGINGNVIINVVDQNKSPKVAIRNGGTAGIELEDGSNVYVPATDEYGPRIVFNADDGPFTMNGGYLAAEGFSAQPGGSIAIEADTINLLNGSTLSASDAGTGSNKYITLAASEISYTDGLTLWVNGDNDGVGGLYFSPKGSLIYTVPMDYTENISLIYTDPTRDSLTVTGDGTLSLYTFGDDSDLMVSGYPLTFSGDAVNMFAIGEGTSATLTYTGSPAANTSLSFAGGEVNVYTDNDTGGNAGNIYVRADRIATTTPVGFWANATGQSGNGGIISVELAGGTLPVGEEEFKFIAYGSYDGQGGQLLIDAPNATVELTDSYELDTIYVNGGEGGSGGTIDIKANSLVSDTDAQEKSALYALGIGPNATGGTIKLELTQSFTIGDEAGGVNGRQIELVAMVADIGSGAGDGGTVEVTTAGDLTVNNARIYVNGGHNGGEIRLDAANLSFTGYRELFANGTGSGAGGLVHLTSSANRINLVEVVLHVTGGDSGQGGNVIVDNVDLFDVNTNVEVDAGSQVGSNAFHGSVTLNSVYCQLWKTEYNWPTEYWNCTLNDPPTAEDEAPTGAAADLPTGLKTVLEEGNTQLYVFADASAYSLFFNDSIEEGLAGHTFVITPGITHYVAIMEHAPDPVTEVVLSLTEENIREHTTHELGHAVDHFNFHESEDTPYDAFARKDFLDLDYYFVGEDALSSIPRPACDPIGADPAPFAGVIDVTTGEPVCDGDVLANSEYQNLTNSQILQVIQGHIFLPDPPDVPEWIELYAQAFAYQAYSKDLSPNDYSLLVVTADGVFSNGYFACTRAWASGLLGQTASTTGCASGAPGWYEPGF